MDKVTELTCELIRRQSVTPDDAGCQELIRERLERCGFVCELLNHENVSNLWAVRDGQQGQQPLFCFAGHTDVVPTGPVDNWSSNPFEPTVRDGRLFGRGVADMKGSIAAMICAIEDFIATHPTYPGQIALLITSDEEGPAIHGTKHVMEVLQQRNIHIDHCLVGEPSSGLRVGDTARVGRRGSLNARVTVNGVQGHVAFPEKALNPIHVLAPALTRLCAEQWDQGNEYFPATSFQVSNLNSGTGATNVIPGSVEMLCNFRFSTAVTDTELINRTEKIFADQGIVVSINWHLSGQPFLSKPDKLTRAVQDAVREVTDQEIELSTGGGTSDGRFIAPTGCEVVELGPLNATIHQIDEHVGLDELITLGQLYGRILEKLLTV